MVAGGDGGLSGRAVGSCDHGAQRQCAPERVDAGGGGVGDRGSRGPRCARPRRQHAGGADGGERRLQREERGDHAQRQGCCAQAHARVRSGDEAIGWHIGEGGHGVAHGAALHPRGRGRARRGAPELDRRREHPAQAVRPGHVRGLQPKGDLREARAEAPRWDEPAPDGVEDREHSQHPGGPSQRDGQACGVVDQADRESRGQQGGKYRASPVHEQQSPALGAQGEHGGLDGGGVGCSGFVRSRGFAHCRSDLRHTDYRLAGPGLMPGVGPGDCYITVNTSSGLQRVSKTEHRTDGDRSYRPGRALAGRHVRP